MNNDQQPVPIKIPLSTILAIILTILLVRIVESIAPLILPLIISTLIAVSLMPLLNWMVGKKFPRAIAIALIAVMMILVSGLIVITLVPSIYHEASNFIENLPQFREELLKNIGPDNPLHGFISHGLTKDILVPKANQIRDILGAGNMVLGGFAEIVLILILAVYLVADGPRIVEWLSAYFSPATQSKIQQTTSSVSKIISAYVFGQFLTSILSFLFVLIALSALQVPGALLLASLAGIFDVLPVLGFFLAVIPAMLFAANISLKMSLIVFFMYGCYHAVENYLIVPMVYGNRMRVSSFVVFFTLLAAGLVGGVEGAIVILPIVASYPIIEQIWLKPYLRKETVAEHAADPLL